MASERRCVISQPSLAWPGLVRCSVEFVQALECSQTLQSLQLQTAEEEREKEVCRERMRERLEEREKATQQLRR